MLYLLNCMVLAAFHNVYSTGSRLVLLSSLLFWALHLNGSTVSYSGWVSLLPIHLSSSA